MKGSGFTYGVGLGLLFGVGLGGIFDNLALGLGLGVAVGVLAGLFLGGRKKDGESGGDHGAGD